MKKNNKTVTKLRTGDEVIVIAGKDIGKKGTVQTISKLNNKLIDNPELINTSPYSDGWIVKINIDKKIDTNQFLRIEEYKDFIK